MKRFRSILCTVLILALLASMCPVYAMDAKTEDTRSIQSFLVIDDDPTGGYTGDYVVIYNPNTDASSSLSTGSMSGLIQTSVASNATVPAQRSADAEARPYIIDIDSLLAESEDNAADAAAVTEPVRASYTVGSTKTFTIDTDSSPTGSSSVEFKCLYVGEHCYIWTPTSSANNTYPLDTIDQSFAKLAADEFDGKFNLMQYSFGNHTNGSNGDGKLHILYYNIEDGWQPGQGYVAGFFWGSDLTHNGLPMLNIDTYPGVYYPDYGAHIEDTYSTMVHEYQHLINYSNTHYMSTWLNECFSAAAEEICYPGSSVIPRIQSWEKYSYSNNNTWLNPPSEFAYQSSYNLHNGYSMYAWNNNLSDILALYAQVSFFAQYLYSRFGNSIYREISNNWTLNKEVEAITNATGVNCSKLVRDFRVALTANATQYQYDGVYGFKVQDGYDPSTHHNVQNPWSLLGPVVFTGSSCSIQGGGAITVKPVNGVYNPPAGAAAGLEYIGISFSAPHTVTAVSNNSAWGTVSVDGYVITATPAAGYYVSGCQVTSGTATTSVNGNTIVVSPSSDCTVRVNFAAKPTYTVSYMVCGQSMGSQSAKLYDTINLPATVSVNPEGWTFAGWTAQQILNETTQKPEFYEPGAAYTVNANTTLHALFTRREGDAPLSYQLVNAVPADWTGNYVISSGTGSDMVLMRGVSVDSDGQDIESSTNAASAGTAGATLAGSALYNVPEAFIFTAKAHGTYYSMQNISTGVYLGQATNGYLGGYNNYTASYCDWELGVSTNASCMKCQAGGSYPYINYTSNSGKFWCMPSADDSIRFWKATGGYTDYYQTNPTGAVHTHSYGDWTSNNNGTHSRTCACGDKQTENCSYTEVVTPPTTTSQGYTTHTCTVCGYSYRDNYTDPIVNPVYYTINFSVPNGVNAIASQTVASNSAITLPTAGTVDGYSFAGWTTGTVAETTS
ncbi:MAG: InlB B-repeat-containing protein, partial [Oscillospiraceae bacterium]|nr:InlB B-repeat-containing protein [Oscillospiraceae bacterium]